MSSERTTLESAETRALDLIRASRRFLLCGHVKPDGDCVGSQAAMARVLESLGKEVWIVNPDPIDEQFDYLARDIRYKAFSGGDLPAHDVAIFLDFCELMRTGAMEKALRAAPSKKLVVDHHIFHGEPWWDEAFVDVRAAATGVVVYRMAKLLGAKLDAVAASGVFTATVTDTGWFKYSNTNSEVFAIASELVAAGCDPSTIFNAIYQRSSRGEPKAIGRALSRLEYFADGRLAVVDLPRAQTGEPELADSDVVLDILRAVATVEVVLFLREQKDGTCKLSARSKGAFNVNQLARKFGGGGHAKASGATLAFSLGDAKHKLVAGALEQLAESAPRGS